MVAKIISGKSIRGILQYNENKVNRGEAKLILASGFAHDIEGLKFLQKIQRFTNLTMLNSRVKTNALHISLNFHQNDQLNGEQLTKLCMQYMERIGFADQPFLVYLHYDAAHPHVHIATTTIRSDGSRIDIHGIGRTLSESARKDLENEFNLVKADGRQVSGLSIKPVAVQKADYGKTPTKQAISNVINHVFSIYAYSSLAEYNMVLKRFNVTAMRGTENSMMFKKGGLMYSITNQNGEAVGIPIKASEIYGKPTLARLEMNFERNEQQRKGSRIEIRNSIDEVFSRFQSITKATFIAEMAKQDVDLVFQQNKEGFIYGLTLIDHANKTVFKGSDLGKDYSAKAFLNRFQIADKSFVPEKKTYLKTPKLTNFIKKSKEPKIYLNPPDTDHKIQGFLNKTSGATAAQLPKRKKKKKQLQQEQTIR